MISLPEESTFLIKMTIKTVTPLSAYKKNWCALTAFKKPIMYHNNNWHKDQTRFRKLYFSSVIWGLLAQMGSGFFKFLTN